MSIDNGVVVVDEDPDLLVPLLHNLNNKNRNLFYTNEPKKFQEKKMWQINFVLTCLGKISVDVYYFAFNSWLRHYLKTKWYRKQC